MNDEGTCASCAKGNLGRHTEQIVCTRHQEKIVAWTWPDATCPAWEKRRDKLDERADELTQRVCGSKHFSDQGCQCSGCTGTRHVIRTLLKKWAAEDKEAK